MVSARPSAVVTLLMETALSSDSQGCDVHLLELNGVAVAERERAFENLLKDAGLVLPDGRWLELLTARTSAPLHQFRGEDLLKNLCDRGRTRGLRHFFVGTTREHLESLIEQLEKLYPGILAVGRFAPPFRDMTDGELGNLTSEITASKAHIVWIGMSTPRQDYVAQSLANSSGTVVIAVGAAFDFVSGAKHAAPQWMTRWGIEWFFRLASEPGRLWKRYLVGGVLFGRRVFRFRNIDLPLG